MKCKTQPCTFLNMIKAIKLLVIFFVLFLSLGVISLSYHIGGWRAFIVMSSSMEPTIKTGSLVITQQIHPKTLKMGDIITFISPTKDREFITHRISSISQNGSVSVIKTKGDNNKAPDNWVLAGGGVAGKVVFTIPGLGYIFSWSRTKEGIILLILIPAAFIIVGEIRNIFNIVKNNRQKPTTTHKQALGAILIMLFAVSCLPTGTNSLLSDTATLKENHLTVASKSNNCGNQIIDISGNGTGSVTIVKVSCDSSSSSVSNNSTEINTNINSNQTNIDIHALENKTSITNISNDNSSNVSVTTN